MRTCSPTATVTSRPERSSSSAIWMPDRKSTRLNSQAHRDLHSVPTRRSSDLHDVPAAVGPRHAHVLADRDGHLPAGAQQLVGDLDARSEEHTSELPGPPRSTLCPYTTLFRST